MQGRNWHSTLSLEFTLAEATCIYLGRTGKRDPVTQHPEAHACLRDYRALIQEAIEVAKETDARDEMTSPQEGKPAGRYYSASSGSLCRHTQAFFKKELTLGPILLQQLCYDFIDRQDDRM